ncbi:MAG: NAD(P)-binding domain-containing protein [Chitinophagaceae bacterium]|nr:NAD(P)-binding domain-containing protein [Chitinophagaceae bacterium]
MKKIGIIGSGQVAQTLGKGFLKYGYEVMLGTRDKSKLDDWRKDAGKEAHVGSFEDAAKFGDIIVLAVLGRAAAEALDAAGAENLVGKTVIDTTNPISENPPQDGVLHFFSKTHEALMEMLQDRFKGANFVKAFNSVGSPFMVDPQFAMKPSMFICGNDDNAKSEVSEILDKFGWEVEDMGKATAARAIEPLCILWCIPGFLSNQWSHAFKLMRQ